MTIGMNEKINCLDPIQFERLICNIEGRKDQPLLIFTCGIHGNEPMSVHAMTDVAKELEEKKIKLNGSLIGITGNVAALKKGERFLESDLNRLWLTAQIDEISNGELFTHEKAEMKDIWAIIEEKLKERKQSNVVIFDLHTTSSPSVPFITINDTISNRNIAKKYPVATVFGIEEFLNGPLLSYINELGFNAIGFEGGQHFDSASLKNHIAFIWLSLANQKLISTKLPQVKAAKKRLNITSVDSYKFFEITHRHEVYEDDEFSMIEGYMNFQTIERDWKLADSNGKEILSKWNDRIFMPLYQSKGDDGFFIIRRIPQFYLWLSKILRKYSFERILLLLPGVSTFDKKKHILAVDNKIARILRNDIFHLLGFRQKVFHTQDVTLFIRREKQ